jgi:t-SNARE complex subunit (syntaxin)
MDQAMQEYYGETTEEQEAYIEDLQRESAYLTASLQNELEDVHKIEGKMMEITTLLRQFGDLVSEQQEDIVAIHDQAESSKKNIQAGQDRLVDAGERKKKSKHYMATFIVCMALLLLFLNWITP